MNILKVFITLIIISLMTWLGIQAKNSYQESQSLKCVVSVLSTEQQRKLSIDFSGRANSPVLTGSFTIQEQQTIMQKIKQNCSHLQPENFMKVPKPKKAKTSEVTIEIDKYNQTVLIKGVVSDNDMHQRVLDVVTGNFSQMTVNQMLQVDKTLEPNNLEDGLALALTQVEPIEMANLTLSASEIILRGLIRDKDVEAKVINQYQLLFEPEINVINKLERVIKNKSLFDDEFLIEDKIKLPEIEIELPEIE